MVARVAPQKDYPTLVRAGWEDNLMEDEVFGPVLPMLCYSGTDGMIRKLQGMPAPLAAHQRPRRQRPPAKSQ
jgi:acyl-CoA reductase-like NAD-dependent aldehyde dehydrogenase